MKKLFAFDIDGTLMPEGKELLQSSIEAIEMINNHGDIAILATGRSFNQTIDIARTLGIKKHLICISGLVYANLETSSVQIVNIIDSVIVEYFINLAKKVKRQLNIKLDKKAVKYYFGNDPKQDINADSLFWKKGGTLNPIYDDFNNFKNDISYNEIIQISIKSEKEIIDEIFESVKIDVEKINPDYTVKIISDVYLEVHHKNFNKALAIDRVRKQENIDPNNVYVFGDSNNDLEMVEYFKHGIAMGNSNNELKKVASEIIDNCEDNGIFNYISKLYKKK